MDGVRVRRQRPPAKPGEIVAAAGVVLAGLAVMAAIVLVDPRWQRLLAARRARFVNAPSAAGPQLPAPRANGLEVQPATVQAPVATPRASPEPAPPQPDQAMSARAEPTPAAGLPGGAESDMTQIMASLLVSQLGYDPAWRTAIANADAHVANSPEHAYWRAVAAAIREGLRPRP